MACRAWSPDPALRLVSNRLWQALVFWPVYYLFLFTIPVPVSTAEAQDKLCQNLHVTALHGAVLGQQITYVALHSYLFAPTPQSTKSITALVLRCSFGRSVFARSPV